MKIRAIVYGVGKMGILISKYMIEKGVDIVGAIDINPAIVGKDLGEVAGLGRDLNVIIRKDADEVLSEYKADIAIVAVYTDMERMYPIFEKCIENNFNVLTTAGGCAYNWSTHPELTAKLDKLAKKHNVTLTASGLQDSFLINMVTLMTGASHTITSVEGKQKFNLSRFGPVAIRQYGAGKTKEEFYESVAVDHHLKSALYSRLALETLIADLGLTIREMGERIDPVIGDENVLCEGLGTTIKKGLARGMIRTHEAITEQEIRFRFEEIGVVYTMAEEASGDVTNEWFIDGEPQLHMVTDRMSGPIATCAQVVNRIPDVINSEPGYVSVDRLPKLKFRAFPLHFYLQRGR